MDRLPRGFVMNLLYTLKGQEFAHWVSVRVEERNSRLASDNNKMIDVCPSVAAAFEKSTHLSCKYPRQHLLCRFEAHLSFFFISYQWLFGHADESSFKEKKDEVGDLTRPLGANKR